jgi:hypothetical protein
MAEPLKWLVGGIRTQIKIAVDRKMTIQQRAKSRAQTKPVKPKKGGGK